MITIISDDSKNYFTDTIKESIKKTTKKIVVFKANDLNVEPCLACASCGGKTYGRCILEDDMQKILPQIVRSEKIILFSPIVYGGVSFHIKKIMDRISSVGDPRYYMKNGELVKKMRIPDLKYYMVGIKENLTFEEELLFIKLHEENINIMSVDGKAFIVEKKLDNSIIEEILKEIIYD